MRDGEICVMAAVSIYNAAAACCTNDVTLSTGCLLLSLKETNVLASTVAATPSTLAPLTCISDWSSNIARAISVLLIMGNTSSKVASGSEVSVENSSEI